MLQHLRQLRPQTDVKIWGKGVDRNGGQPGESTRHAIVDNHIAWVWTFRDDQAVRLVVYEEQAEALEAVGLSE